MSGGELARVEYTAQEVQYEHKGEVVQIGFDISMKHCSTRSSRFPGVRYENILNQLQLQ